MMCEGKGYRRVTMSCQLALSISTRNTHPDMGTVHLSSELIERLYKAFRIINLTQEGRK